MIDLRFERGLADGNRLRAAMREFVRVVERGNLLPLPDSAISIDIVPAVEVQRAFGAHCFWEGTNEYTLQIAGWDWMRPRNRREAAFKVRVLEDFPGLDKVPWVRRACWTLAHELIHVTGEMDDDVANADGLKLLDAARAKSTVLRAGTRRT